jgi:hypothetical protein
MFELLNRQFIDETDNNPTPEGGRPRGAGVLFPVCECQSLPARCFTRMRHSPDADLGNLVFMKKHMTKDS